MEIYEKKEIDDYVVRPMMQRVWAAQIDVVLEIDKICRRHSITWFAAFGTLLGAVRHKGFIPWDDDIDIGMRRLDFERFKKYAKEELPKEYIYSIDRGADIKDLVFCVKNSGDVNIDEEYLATHHGCPYPVGVDIYVYDNIPDDPKEREDYIALFTYTLCGAQEIESWMTYKDCTEETRKIIDESERMTGVHFERDIPLKKPLLTLADQIAAMYYDEKTKHVAIAGYLVWGENFLFDTEWFSSVVKLPFEGIQVNCPVEYKEILKRDFGDDYMIPKKYQDHEHSFIRQEKELHKWFTERGLSVPVQFAE